MVLRISGGSVRRVGAIVVVAGRVISDCEILLTNVAILEVAQAQCSFQKNGF